MGYICKVKIDGKEETFEYDSKMLNELITMVRGQEIRIDLNKKVLSVSQFSACSKCGKTLLVSIEVDTIESNTDRHICEYCSKCIDKE